MDRVNQLRGCDPGSAASSPLSSSGDSLAYVSATGDDTKYFSLSEADSTLDDIPSEDFANTSDNVVSPTLHDPENNLDSFRLGQTIEAANILSGGVNIFEDNDNSFDGNELVIDDNVAIDVDKKLDHIETCVTDPDSALVDNETNIPSKETEVQLQIDGKNVDAIDIGNGLYLYRRDGEEELAAVQVFTEGDEQSFKFLKVRENAESNLEVYEEIEVEVTKNVPSKATKSSKNTSSQVKHVAKSADVSKETKMNEEKSPPAMNVPVNVPEKTNNPSGLPNNCSPPKNAAEPLEPKLSPSRGSFMPMAYHSTPNKDGIPLTKTMVDQQLHPSRHSDIVKKTIEVNTENCKQKSHDKGKLSSPTEDYKDKSLEIKLKNNQSLEPLSSVETKSLSKVTSTITKDENINRVHDNEALSFNDNRNQKSSQPTIHLLAHSTADLTQESKLDEIKDLNTNIMPENKTEVLLLTESKEKVASKENSNLAIVEDSKSKDKEAATINARVTSIVEGDTTTLKVSANDPINQPTVAERTDIQSATLQNPPTTTKPSEVAEDKEIVVIKNVDKNDINTPTVSKVSPGQSNVNTTLPKHDETKQTESQIVQAPTQSEGKAAQTTSKKENSFKILENDEVLNGKKSTVNVSSSIDQRNNKALVEQVGEANEKLTHKSTSRVASQPDQDFLTITHSNDSNLNTDSSKLSASQIISNVNLSNKTVNDKFIFKSNTNNRSDELIQLTDLGVEVTAEALPDIIEKGFPDCLKSVADILKPKSYDSKRDHSIPQLQIKMESNTSSKIPTLIAKPDSLVHKSDAPKLEITNVTLVTKSEALPSPDDKQKSNLTVLTHKSGDSLISKYVNRAVIIKNTVASSNIQVATIVKKNETVVSDSQAGTTSDIKPKILNNNSAVPFGKWTEANKQAYLNKINEPKVIANPNQIKQAKDLNRRDILKKMDSQRQSFVNYSRSLEVLHKANVKKEQTVYAAKVIPKLEIKPILKIEPVKPKIKETCSVPAPVQYVSAKTTKPQVDDKASNSGLVEDAPKNRQDFNNQDLIDKTIEGLMDKNTSPISPAKPKTHNVDEVEKKMNDLHGIPFVERPQHELPSRYNRDSFIKTSKRSTNTQIKKELNMPPVTKPLDTVPNKIINLDEDSEDEVLEHEPVTGDMQYNKSNFSFAKVTKADPLTHPSSSISRKASANAEKEITKSGQGRSIVYESCMKVTSHTKTLQNALNNITQKDEKVSQYTAQPSRFKCYQNSSSLKSDKTPHFQPISTQEMASKTSPSKVQMAYTSAMTAKQHNKVSPITVIDDRPVKVVFLDQSTNYTPSSSLTAHDDKRSPIKQHYNRPQEYQVKSQDSDRNVSANISKQDEPKKHQIKHQRKQVLTPVDESSLEIVSAPVATALDKTNFDNLKRATEGNVTSTDKSIIPKKTYLLGRSAVGGDLSKEIPTSSTLPISDAASAIDNLVKAAEMLDSQQNIVASVASSSNSPQAMKRGRGRPRKHPLATSIVDTPLSPQKKPRVTRTKRISTSEEDETSTDDDMVMVNWTMGKINENIVCPICGKLFRSENVVFKHVKHCTGPSPNRSETSERRTSKRGRRRSGDSNNSSIDTLTEKSSDKVSSTPDKGRKRSNESEKVKPDTADVIIIEDTPIKGKQRDESVVKNDAVKEDEPVAKKEPPGKEIVVPKLSHNSEVSNKYGNIVCEKCKKVFRQMSYYAKHRKEECKSQLKKDLPKNKTVQNSFKSVFCCEVCKKDFRKLHHLVQHRIIHEPTSSRRRKSSVEQVEKTKGVQSADDTSAGFRCEACDKSFRKLHHLVEHRETHDGLTKNKQLSSPSQVSDKPDTTSPRCDVCNKTFRKLHHMIEHKEQHANPKPDKTDDKNNKAATTDIIHECPLCYMVFPNEHSLNRHVNNCQKKKRQSLSKSGAELVNDESASVDDTICESVTTKPSLLEDSVSVPTANILVNTEKEQMKITHDRNTEPLSNKVIPTETPKTTATVKTDFNLIISSIPDKQDKTEKIHLTPLRLLPKESNNKTTDTGRKKKLEIVETTVNKDTPSKEAVLNRNIPATVTRRLKSSTPVAENNEVSDDEDVRYMLNPEYEAQQAAAADIFMSEMTRKRNSLQIDRPTSKVGETLKRRISLQIHSKLHKRNPVDAKPKQTTRVKISKTRKPKGETLVNTSDSDDSDTKYAFPEVSAKAEPKIEEPPKNVVMRKRSITEKRKSLTGLAKRKSFGVVNVKASAAPSLPKPAIKRRTLLITEHKCDCGQTFTSGVLLSQHASLAHTPPRRQRVAPTDTQTGNRSKRNLHTGKQNTKSTVVPKKSKVETPPSTRGKTPNALSSTSRKRRKSGFHSGVPVPAKMKELFKKQKQL